MELNRRPFARHTALPQIISAAFPVLPSQCTLLGRLNCDDYRCRRAENLLFADKDGLVRAGRC